tara:strand:+ start:350 stop:838 length:489 start_codon:yes stop_codon:yes gene_type:complete
MTNPPVRKGMVRICTEAPLRHVLRCGGFCHLILTLMCPSLTVEGETTMNDILPEAVRMGLEQARKASLRRKDRLCVHDGDDVYGIRRFWEGGFALDADVAEKLRGRVEIYDGARHLYQCLIVGSVIEGEERVFDFKWLHPVTDAAPVDFERPDFVPAGLLSK